MSTSQSTSSAFPSIAPIQVNQVKGEPSKEDAPAHISKDARNQLLEIFGEERFKDGASTREQFAKTTLPTSTTPLGVVWPESKDEVVQLMKVLGNHGTPWHAISKGKNWGYGDACAPHDGHLIVDLRRMNRIVEINEELAYAVIEPGVSQGELATELRDRGSRLMLDVTGAGPRCEHRWKCSTTRLWSHTLWRQDGQLVQL